MIRRNLITGAPIVFAPERAGRPHAFINGGDGSNGELCPFCPGNEGETPPEICRTGGSAWRTRVFPNKYPVFEHHELIVDSPDHEATFDTVAHAEETIGVYMNRYRSMLARPGMVHVALFKNHGRNAGASLAHIHSQVAGMPFVPPRIADETAAFASATACPLCAAIDEHRRDGLVIAETERLMAFAPRASSFAHQQWIFPKEHRNDLVSLTDSECADLAALLQQATRAMRRISPAHNWLFLGFPNRASAHCYVDVFPRVTNVAGFELSTGTFIDIVDPAASTRLLRGSE